MDQVSLIDKLNRCIEHHRAIKVQMECFDGKIKKFLFEPYLIGENPASDWTFIYGKAVEKNAMIMLGVPFITSFEETDDSFEVAEKDKTFLVSDNVKNKVIKSIPELEIIDISEPEEEEEEEEDDDISKPFADTNYGTFWCM